ncbi:hypothetical protein GCM10027447_01610 [Glycomyces halotolerans]
MNSSGEHVIIDGLAVTRLPSGLGRASDFEYEWGGVDFLQRVWESEVEAGVWRVDLQIHAMRAEHLTDPQAMREFLIEYHEKDPSWATEQFGDDGFAAERAVMRFIESGLAAEVRDPFGRQGPDEVKAIAAGLRLIEL